MNQDPTPQITTLPNGLRVATRLMPGLHSTALGIWVNAGGRNERPEQNGIAHFLEHMAFKGTRTRSVQAINLDAERLGRGQADEVEVRLGGGPGRGLGRARRLDEAGPLEELGELARSGRDGRSDALAKALELGRRHLRAAGGGRAGSCWRNYRYSRRLGSDRWR